MLAPQVRELLTDGRESIASSIKAVLGDTTVEPTILAALLLAFFDGLALQKIMDPDLDISAFAVVLTRIFRSFERQPD